MITEEQRDDIVMSVDSWGMARWWHAWCCQATPTGTGDPVTNAAERMWTEKFRWLLLVGWHVGEGRLPATVTGNLTRQIELWGAVRAEQGRMAAHPTAPVLAETTTDETSPSLREEWLSVLDDYTRHPRPAALTTGEGR